MTEFIIILVIFIPQIVILLDYIIKSIYISYWDGIYEYRLDTLISYLSMNNNNLKIIRKTIDHKYILSLNFEYNRRYEYKGDGKGHIEILGNNTKKVKTIIGKYFIAPTKYKLPHKCKDNYVELIQNFYTNTYACPLNLNIKNLNLKPNNDEITNPKISDIKKLVKTVYVNRCKSDKIYKYFKYDKFKDECISKFENYDKLTKKDINDFITDKIHDKAMSEFY